MERILNMVLRGLVRKGIDTGIDVATRRGAHGKDATPQDRELARQGKDTNRTMRQASRVLRRFIKF